MVKTHVGGRFCRKCLRLKVHVFSDRILCVGRRTFDLSGREVRFAWHIFLGVAPINLKEEMESFLNGMEADTFSHRIVSVSMFNDNQYWRRDYDHSCMNHGEVARCASIFQNALDGHGIQTDQMALGILSQTRSRGNSMFTVSI